MIWPFSLLKKKKQPTVSVSALQLWHNENINQCAFTIGERFSKFKHIIEVDPNKILIFHMLTEVDSEFKQYQFPNRKIEDHAVLCDVRGVYTHDEKIFQFNEFGKDHVFVATNNDEDAIMIALKYK